MQKYIINYHTKHFRIRGERMKINKRTKYLLLFFMIFSLIFIYNLPYIFIYSSYCLENSSFNEISGIWSVREFSRYILIKISPLIKPYLIKTLANRDMADYISKIICSMQPPPEESIRKALKNKNPNIRWAAARIMSEYKNNKSVHCLINCVEDENKEVQAEILCSLGILKDKEAYPVIERYAKDKNIIVRNAAIGALGNLQDERATGVLIESLKDANKGVRENTIENLSRIGTPEAMKGIVFALNDPDISVRKAAIRCLSNNPPKTAILPLIKLLNDENEEIQLASIFILGYFKDQRAVSPLIDKLKENNIDHEKIFRIVATLGNIGDKRAISPILETQAKFKDNIWINEACKESLRKLSHDRQIRNQ